MVTMRKKTWLSWSSGKDSAWALHVFVKQRPILSTNQRPIFSTFSGF